MADENEFAVPSATPAETRAPELDALDREAPADAAPEAPVAPVAPTAPAAEVPVAPAAPAPAQAAQIAAPAAKFDPKAPIAGLKDTGLTGLEGAALATKEKLAKESKVRMMIPLDPGEKPGAYRTVIINGYRFDVKKNVMVDLPQSVAALLSDAYRITNDVLENNERNLAHASDDTRKALGI